MEVRFWIDSKEVGKFIWIVRTLKGKCKTISIRDPPNGHRAYLFVVSGDKYLIERLCKEWAPQY